MKRVHILKFNHCGLLRFQLGRFRALLTTHYHAKIEIIDKKNGIDRFRGGVFPFPICVQLHPVIQSFPENDSRTNEGEFDCVPSATHSFSNCFDFNRKSPVQVIPNRSPC